MGSLGKSTLPSKVHKISWPEDISCTLDGPCTANVSGGQEAWRAASKNSYLIRSSQWLFTSLSLGKDKLVVMAQKTRAQFCACMSSVAFPVVVIDTSLHLLHLRCAVIAFCVFGAVKGRNSVRNSGVVKRSRRRLRRTIDMSRWHVSQSGQNLTGNTPDRSGKKR